MLSGEALQPPFGACEGARFATEFVGTSISSDCGWAGAIKAATSANPHVKYVNPDRRGYSRCVVTPDAWRTDYRVVPSATDPVAPAVTDASWVVESGRPGAVPA